MRDSVKASRMGQPRTDSSQHLWSGYPVPGTIPSALFYLIPPPTQWSSHADTKAMPTQSSYWGFAISCYRNRTLHLSDMFYYFSLFQMQSLQTTHLCNLPKVTEVCRRAGVPTLVNPVGALNHFALLLRSGIARELGKLTQNWFSFVCFYNRRNGRGQETGRRLGTLITSQSCCPWRKSIRGKYLWRGEAGTATPKYASLILVTLSKWLLRTGGLRKSHWSSP